MAIGAIAFCLKKQNILQVLKALSIGMFKTSLHAILISLSLSANAENERNCWGEAGARYGVDPWLLYAIAEQESNFNARAVNTNKDGSRDIGLMQINSQWFQKLKGYGITETDLYDPCTSINVGAWILSGNIIQFGYSWKAIGAYNAGGREGFKQEESRRVYATNIYNRYVNIISSLQQPKPSQKKPTGKGEFARN